jgi:ribonuclease Z
LPEKCAEFGVPTYFYDRIKHGEDYETKTGEIVKSEWVTTDGKNPKHYAYCADTIYTESFLSYIMEVDLMYHESTYLTQDLDKATARYHSTAAQAAEIALKAKAGKLLLGHYSSRYRETDGFYQEAAPIFPNVVATCEGDEYEV